MHAAFLLSPIGTIRISASDSWLTAITIGAESAGKAPQTPLLREAVSQLAAWLEGERTLFELPLAPAHTPRGPAHRQAIADIGYGETASYGELARRIDSSPRAIGQACRRNPFPIIIPCHRVLGMGGEIGHYSAGEGVITKQWLLRHEARRRS